MIVRIVKMSFHPEKVDDFLQNFEKHKEAIRAFEGCSYLELLREEKHPNVYFTHSYWQEATHLQAYRQSSLFKSVWAFTRTLFNEAPEAWSLTSVKTLR